jgi:hypothetical protein
MKILKQKCSFCGKEIESLYLNQLKQNLKIHELSCKENPDNKKVERRLKRR